MVTSLAPAKVNLFLHVGPVQPNGRHPLDSLVMFAGPEASDQVSADVSDELELTVSGPSAGHLAGPDNLVLQAATALRQAAKSPLGARLTLDKHLPVAAGIGGGSADAGATLRVLRQLWSVDEDVVKRVAIPLGGDVPVALVGRTALMQGEGERVRVLADLPQLPCVLVNPGLDCPTGPVFSAFDMAQTVPPFQEVTTIPDFSGAGHLIEWLLAQRNDLQDPATQIVPEIEAVLDAVARSPDCKLARMSGSGATCFGLYATMGDALRAADELSRTHPTWWIRATCLGDAP